MNKAEMVKRVKDVIAADGLTMSQLESVVHACWDVVHQKNRNRLCVVELKIKASRAVFFRA